jgi:hypothetical protein
VISVSPWLKLLKGLVMELILTSPLIAARLKWRLRRMQWQARGGAHLAEMQVDLPPELRPLGTELCCGLLGQPLTVIDGEGAPCWYGYAHAVTLSAEGTARRRSLDGLANRVACLYPVPGAGWAQTAWAEDTESQATWGRHERLLRCSGAGQAEACVLRDAHLAQAAQPRWTAAVPATLDEGRLVIEAHGWWETLGWSYYAPDGGRIEHAISHGVAQPVGAQAANSRVAQSFRLGGESWPAGEVWLRAGKRGAPLDALHLELCSDANAVPGTTLVSAEVNAAAAPYASGWLRFALSSPTLAADTTYWLVLSRSGALDAENYYVWQADEQLGYPDGACCLWNGLNWSARQPPAVSGFRVDGVRPAEELIAALVANDSFISGLRLEDSSGLTALRWRDGRTTCLEELEAVLEAAGMQAEVEEGRVLCLHKAPQEGEADAGLRGGEIVEPSGRAWPPSRPLAGRWLRAGEALVWVEKVVWEEDRMKVG